LKLEERIVATASLMSVTGHEDYDTAALHALMAGFDEQYTDTVGNHLFVRRCGRENAPRILIDTHFDEIGMLVSDILEDGFLRVCAVGGLDARVLPSAEVRIYGSRVIDGVVASTPPHLQSAADEKKAPKVDELLIDTGYSTEELKKILRVGTPAGFLPRYTWLQNRRLAGKGLDNKACCAAAADALLSLSREALAGDVALLFAVHEETDRTGGTAVGGFHFAPDYAMVVDVNLGRAPDTEKRETVALGEGPSLSRSAITDRTLTRMTEELCEREGIAWQRSVDPTSTGTDTVALHLVRGGIPVVDVGLPLRCMHTYNEIVDMQDAEALSRLIAAFVCDSGIAEVFK